MLRLPACVLAVMLAAGTAGCGGSGSSGKSASTARATPAEQSPPGDIPDNQAFVRYASPGAGFSVKVPEGWARATVGRAMVFTDKLNSVRLEAGQASRVARVPGGRVSRVARTAGSAVRTVFVQRSPADPVTGKRHVDTVERYVFARGGRAAVLTLRGPKGADNVDPWRIVTDSFRWR